MNNAILIYNSFHHLTLQEFQAAVEMVRTGRFRMTMSQTNPPPGDLYARTDTTSSDVKFMLLPKERIILC